MFQVIIASFGYAGGVIADKIILSKDRVPVMRFVPLLFIWIAIITGFFLPQWGEIHQNIFQQWQYVGLFALMIVVAITWNILYYQGIQKEDLHEFELIMLLTPIATIALASIFLPSERDAGILIPAFIAAIALLATRFRKHHASIGKTAWKTIIAMVLMSFESILIKELLHVFSPVSLYFFRTLVLAIVFVLLYRPKLFSVPTRAYALTILAALFGVVQMVLKYYGIDSLGVVETTMILVLGPFLVYIASAILFKEHLYKRDLAAAAVVVACILYVEFWR